MPLTPVLQIPKFFCPECREVLHSNIMDEIRVMFKHPVPMQWGDNFEMAAWDGSLAQRKMPLIYNVNTGALPLPQPIIKCSRIDEEIIRPLAQFTVFI